MFDLRSNVDRTRIIVLAKSRRQRDDNRANGFFFLSDER